MNKPVDDMLAATTYEADDLRSPHKAALSAHTAVDYDALARYKQAMRRFAPLYKTLPVATRATCVKCGQVCDATFDRAGTTPWQRGAGVSPALTAPLNLTTENATPTSPPRGRDARETRGRDALATAPVALTYDCPRCGRWSEVHADAIWTPIESDFPGSATCTIHGSRIRPILRRLPRTVESLCPECSGIILSRYFVEHGAVWIEKTCPEHGYFRDCINSDALLYSKAAWWSFEEHPGQKFPQVTGGKNCPSDCGLCNQHLSSACLAQIDLTNRCNMRCPICFANAGVLGYVCQPDFDQVVRQLQTLRDLRPTPCTAIQFTGGEPTIHPDFLKIVATARDMGFSHIQIATNGIRMADFEFAKAAHEAGLHVLYLQFDGVGDKPYEHTRNYPGIWAKKVATVENCRRLGMKICLVPTILKGINDDQVGEIFRFACENIDTVSAISYQPVSFTGRMTPEELTARRYTLGDLCHGIAKASGASVLRDMFPLSVVVPLAQILEALTGSTKIRPSCHTDCSLGTYFLVSPDKKAYPFPQVVNIEGMFSEMNAIAADIQRKGKATGLDKWRVFRMFKRHFRPDAAPPGLTVKLFIRSLQGLVDKHVGRGEGEKNTYKTLLCAGMHFQDRYNYDIERTKRCVILYSTPAGVFPFCSYNCGPEYRPLVERAYAMQTSQ